ncbi:MAG: hypothetical protein V4684_02245 [Pseudomonadota bacterium]
MSAKEPLLPVATTQTARSLIRLYARLKGEVQKAVDGEEALMWPSQAKTYMRYITSLMTLLGVDWDPSLIKPRKTRAKNGPVPWAKLRPGVLAVLRANKGWMTYEEIAVAILKREGVTVEGAPMSLFRQRVREGCWFLVRDGLIEKETPSRRPESEKLQRFRLSAKRFRLQAD